MTPASTSWCPPLLAQANFRRTRKREADIRVIPGITPEMIAVHLAIVLLFSLFQFTSAQNYNNQPIHMNRREVGVFGEIVSELKGKAMGGRMRFGKRGLNFNAYDYAQQPERTNHYGYVY